MDAEMPMPMETIDNDSDWPAGEFIPQYVPDETTQRATLGWDGAD